MHVYVTPVQPGCCTNCGETHRFYDDTDEVCSGCGKTRSRTADELKRDGWQLIPPADQ